MLDDEFLEFSVYVSLQICARNRLILPKYKIPCISKGEYVPYQKGRHNEMAMIEDVFMQFSTGALITEKSHIKPLRSICRLGRTIEPCPPGHTGECPKTSIKMILKDQSKLFFCY